MSMLLPLFPLKMVVFPEESLNLRVFETRYKQLINECIDENKTFGIPSFLNNKIMDIGTEVEIIEVSKRYDDGKLDIKTKGKRIFRIDEFHRTVSDKLYAAADVSFLEYEDDSDLLLNVQILEKAQQLFKILKIKKTIPINPKNIRTFQLAHHVGFSHQQEYDFLQIPSERTRQVMMNEHLKKMIPIVEEMNRLRERAKLNGQFKEIKGPNF